MKEIVFFPFKNEDEEKERRKLRKENIIRKNETKTKTKYRKRKRERELHFQKDRGTDRQIKLREIYRNNDLLFSQSNLKILLFLFSSVTNSPPRQRTKSR